MLHSVLFLCNAFPPRRLVSFYIAVHPVDMNPMESPLEISIFISSIRFVLALNHSMIDMVHWLI